MTTDRLEATRIFVALFQEAYGRPAEQWETILGVSLAIGETTIQGMPEAEELRRVQFTAKATVSLAQRLRVYDDTRPYRLGLTADTRPADPRQSTGGQVTPWLKS